MNISILSYLCSPRLVGTNYEPDDELKRKEDDHSIIDHLDDEDDPGVFQVSVIVLEGRDTKTVGAMGGAREIFH